MSHGREILETDAFNAWTYQTVYYAILVRDYFKLREMA
jgi:hypothetical protein